jgi:hypothetical protein
MSSVPVRSGRLRRGERVSLAVALAWSVAFLVVAATLPSYEVVSESPSGGVVHDSATTVEVNDASILLILGLPLLATIIVGGALWRRGGRVVRDRSRGGRG